MSVWERTRNGKDIGESELKKEIMKKDIESIEWERKEEITITITIAITIARTRTRGGKEWNGEKDIED